MSHHKKRMKNHRLVQEGALLFLVFFVGQQLKVVCFLQPDNRPDESYLGFTYEATDFSPAQEYDYIIVGGGTAGCPLAATLSEKYSVLLLERGGVVNLDPDNVYENNTAATLKESNHKDSPTQNFISEDGVPNTRGRVLGGSSMLTFGFYSRADDNFYKTSGIEWNMSDVERAYQWVEDSIVTRPVQINRWQVSFLNALLESGIGPDNGFTVDHVQGTKVSGSTFDDSGTRHGAVELLNKANPKNLHALVHAVVDRVIFSTTKSLAAVGITYHDSKGRYHEVRIRRKGEVILSAGAIGSPQLLLLSGLGPHSYLSSLNIPVVRDHSFIGQFMADNPRTGINLLVPVTLEEGGVRVVGITKSGPYIDSAAVPKLVPPISYIPLLGSHSPIYSSVVVIGAKITKTISSGSLHLISPSDVTVSPTVRFNYYSHNKDILQCGKALHVIKKILETRAMEEYKFLDYHGRKYFKYIGSSLPEDPSDVESMKTFCRETLSTLWHIRGGCIVRKVVDSHLKVTGVDSLRVVDASTFSKASGTNPQATIMMLGRYIGMQMLMERD